MESMRRGKLYNHLILGQGGYLDDCTNWLHKTTISTKHIVEQIKWLEGVVAVQDEMEYIGRLA